MNFLVKPYDPLDEAIQLFKEFNETPAEEREYTEEQLIQLVSHKVKTHAQPSTGPAGAAPTSGGARAARTVY